jgi:hypothetical protein
MSAGMHPMENIPESNCEISGVDAERFRDSKVGDEVKFNGQAKIISKEDKYDEKGNKTFEVELYITNTFLESDIESKLEGKEF